MIIFLLKKYFSVHVAVATHKYVISFCVGLELYNADTPKILYASYMLVYALMSSIGIAIGIAVTTTVEDDTTSYLMSVGVLQVRIIIDMILRKNNNKIESQKK